MMIRKLLIGLILLATAGNVLAKGEPYVELMEEDWGGLDEPMAVENALLFADLYGRLEDDEDLDAITYEFEEGIEDFRVVFEVVGCGDGLEAFNPTVALVGAGLETEALADLPFEVTKDQGALVVVASDHLVKARTVNVSSSSSSAPGYVETTVDIPEAGTYTLVVWDEDGDTGAYVMHTGLSHEGMEFSTRDPDERDDAWSMLESGEWMGEDC